jgi:subfamily B ATP-binding cassette protein MsbA
MSSEEKPAKKRKKRNTEFWRAVRFLGPYRRIVAIAMICALITGGIMTAGIGAIYPILQVLIKGDSVQSWVQRRNSEKRLGVDFVDNKDHLLIARIDADGPAAASGIRPLDEIAFVDGYPDNAAATSSSVLVKSTGDVKHLTLRPMPRYQQILLPAAMRLPSQPVPTIAVLFLGIALMGLVGNVFRFFQEYLSDKAAISAVNDIRKRLYDHVLHIPLGFFGLKGTSDVTSRLVQDCLGLQEGFKILLGQTVLEVIRATLAMALAVAIDWRLTLFIVACAPPMAIIMKKFGKKMRRASRAALQTSSSMLGQIEGSLSGIRVVKAVGAERFERRCYATIMEGLTHEQLKMARYEAFSTPVLETMAMWVVGAVLIFSSYLMFVQKSLSINQFLTIMLCLTTIGEALRRVSKLNSVIQRSNAAAARIFETIDIPVERPRLLSARSRSSTATGNGHLINLAPIAREIAFESVTFSYPNAPAPAVLGVELKVAKGKSVAVVGRNGSGKTTLLALLPRFYDPDQGRVTIDGVDIRKVTLRSLRRQIGIVTQDSVIFPGTIAQNIAYGDPRPLATIRNEIESAAKRAFAHDFIMAKSQGYDTSLDGLGGQLSGGQRQRLNIARAILRQAPILILDEATSQVDAESEHLIQQAIEGLMHERTTFVIAHRFSTILSADWIVVMDQGRIVGQGKHEELLRTSETYQQLYERQLVATPA